MHRMSTGWSGDGEERESGFCAIYEMNGEVHVFTKIRMKGCSIVNFLCVINSLNYISSND